jgi:hypothetical protein
MAQVVLTFRSGFLACRECRAGAALSAGSPNRKPCPRAQPRRCRVFGGFDSLSDDVLASDCGREQVRLGRWLRRRGRMRCHRRRIGRTCARQSGSSRVDAPLLNGSLLWEPSCMDTQHSIEIKDVRSHVPPILRAHCSCGWTGVPCTGRSAPALARQDADEHLNRVRKAASPTQNRLG